MSGATIVATSTSTCNKWGHNPGTAKEYTFCVNRGAAYVFEHPAGGWSGVLHQNAVLTASDLAAPTGQLAGAELGPSAAIWGSTIAVAGGGQHVSSTNAGAVYVFEEPAGGWSGP